MRQIQSSLLIAAAAVAVLVTASPAAAQAPTLGTAANFGVLGGSTVTNTGFSQIRGEVGVSPGTAITGFPPGTVTGGTIHSNDAVAQQAQSDLTFAYNGLAALPCNTNLTGTDLGGLTLTAGVYCFSSSAQLTGTLTLDAQGNSNAQFIFQIGSTLTTASNSLVRVINGGSNCGVYFQVGSSATLGTATAFAGNIVALTSITANTGASVSGRLLARNGAVTLDTNNVAVCPACSSAITLAPATLPNGSLGAAYNQTILANGGSAPYSYTIAAGSLPAGLTLSTGGVISGLPTMPGSSTFTVRATDSSSCFGSRIYTIVINGAGCVSTITLTPTTIPAATVGMPYGPVTITAGGGTGPYTFAVTAGALPPGLILTPTSSTTAAISGTPTQSGSFTFTLTATDALNCNGSQIYTALVNCQITITSGSLPSGRVGSPYGPFSLTATGGTGTYTFVVSLGTLPSGLTLSSAGTVTGTPFSTNGPFTILVADSAGCAGARTFDVSISNGAPSGGPTLDAVGMSILLVLLAAAGMFAASRFTS